MMNTGKKAIAAIVSSTPWHIWGWGVLFLIAGIAAIIYGLVKGFSFLLIAGMVYFLWTARGLLLLKHWAWLTALCGFSVTLLFSLLGLLQGSVHIGIALVVWILAGALIWYFTGTAMKQAFGVKSEDVKFLFLLPATVWVLLFTVFPFFYGVRTSFYKVQIGRVDKFVGLTNFIRLFKDYKIHNSVKLTFIFIIVTVVIEILLGLLIALLFNQKLKHLKTYRTIMLMPLFATPVAIGFLFLTIFYEEGGPINGFLIPFGYKIPWLSHPNWSMLSVMLVDIWQWTPFCFLVILAGLQSLPEEIYQAAALDYAPGWQLFRKITLPMLQPVLIIVFLLRLIEACKIFDIPSRLTRGGPGTATMVYSLYTYLTGMKYFDLGYASVQGFALLVVMMIIVTFFFKRMRQIYE
ncbi:putative sugar ABC transporter, permease component [Candidatus Vecturithrix granuli]|uniref:Putative sugar ABC transporter, permease component n=1 Tax=Vecturithrix granuli TaxID=1499967 RepID=A0A081C5T9_VECG1|nr:putative sugar ABC transporter, permease component [Candidatus Vecturithrix granuli]